MNDYLDYLNVKVIQESKPVTYKSLARSLGIHVNTAKQALYDFSKKQENVFAVYCITGISVHNGQFKIQLVRESELEEAKSSYKQLTGIHVYSVTSFNPNDFSIFYAAYEEAPKLAIEDRVKCGILKNNQVKIKETTSNRRTDNKVQQTGKPATSTSSKPSTTINSKPATKPETAKRKGTLNFGPTSSKKQAVESTSTKKTEKPSPKPVVTKSKKESEQDNIAARMAKTSIKASDIFSDDDEEPEPKPVDLKNEDEDIDMEEPVEEEQDTPVATTSTPTRSRKKVLKKKTTRNARGFLVTEEVWEFESGDEDEAPVEAPPKNTPPTNSKPLTKKGPSGSKKTTTQANLFSFFKKV